MLVTNTTAQDYWFGPLHLLGGNGQTLTVDDTTATSLYLLDDSVADAINNLYISGKITVSSEAQPFPRPTGVPSLLHGDGAPEGLVYAPQGSVYLRRDGTGANSLYTKTTGITINTGWENYTTAAVGPGTTYRKTTSKAVNTTVAATDLLNGEITIGAGVLGTTGMLRMTAQCDWINTASGLVAPPRFQAVFGGTTIFDTGVSGTSNNSGRLPLNFLVTISNQGATNVQVCSFQLFGVASPGTATNAAFTTGEGVYQCLGNSLLYGTGFTTAALDTTTAKTLVLNVINGANAAGYETKLSYALVEII